MGISAAFSNARRGLSPVRLLRSGGGGVRQTAPGERPGSTPSVHVEDTQAAYDAAMAAGAEPVSPPTKVMEGVCTAMVRAPGGVLIGFSGPTN